MKIYDNIGSLRLLNIKVWKNDEKVVYEGMVEDAPEDIKNICYSNILIDDNGITNLYIYE